MGRRTLIPVLIILALIAFPIRDSIAQFKNSKIKSITFWEKTDLPPHPFTFEPDSRELNNRVEERPNANNADFIGWNEYYDVFYSDSKGEFDEDGKFITIEAIFDIRYPKDGGLNISEVQLKFKDGTTEYANEVTSYRFLGDNAFMDSLNNAIDGNLLSTTTMGNTSNSTERLKLTVGFKSISHPKKK